LKQTHNLAHYPPPTHHQQPHATINQPCTATIILTPLIPQIFFLQHLIISFYPRTIIQPLKLYPTKKNNYPLPTFKLKL
ncbi:hypothetical protein, partial [Campylobacter canadensis]|uniref:hypothetical protein n=1 Tax=Campylobacter canadensis TaxID=449520 RepID=UPI001CCCE4AC